MGLFCISVFLETKCVFERGEIYFHVDISSISAGVYVFISFDMVYIINVYDKSYIRSWHSIFVGEGRKRSLLQLLVMMVAGKRFQSYCITYILSLGERPTYGSPAAIV